MATNNNDDLLIFSEDSGAIDFWSSIEKKEETNNDDFLFLEEDKSGESPMIFEETAEKTTEETKGSLSDLLWDFSQKDQEVEEKQEENNFLISEEKTDNSSLENISFLPEEPKEEKVETLEVLETPEKSFGNIEEKGIGGMAEILSRTISEFTQRENLIDGDISEKEKHISDLEKELKLEKWFVSDLKMEKDAIEKNRISLEKMKTDFEKKN